MARAESSLRSRTKATAGAQVTDDLRPAASDLRDHLGAREAVRRVLSFDEAAACGKVYMKVKLSFIPGIGPAEFDRLPPEAKAATNLVAYQRYIEWSGRNAAEIAALTAAPPAVPTRAAD